MPLIKEAIANGELFRAHAFEYACARNDIEHRTTKARHPWTTDVIDKSLFDKSALFSCRARYNYGRRLKTLKGLTPYEFICKAWATQPERFNLNPLQQMPGLLYSAC